MTGATLRRLRYGFAMDSGPRLAHHLGVAHSTIYRNERRPIVTEYVASRVAAHPLASAFLAGMTREADRLDLI